MSGLAILLYVEDPAFRSRMEERLVGSGRVQFVEKPEGIAQLVKQLGTIRFDAIYVELGEKPLELLELLERLPEPRPALLLGGSRDDSEALVRAMRLRPEAFIADREIDELDGILEELEKSCSGLQEAHGVIAVTGAKGGVGTTLLACELAAGLQNIGDRVAVVDLGLYQGDVGIYFDLTPPYNLADVARKGDNLDGDFLRRVSSEHKTGLSIISAPQQYEDAALIEPAHIERMIRYLRREYDWVVLDIPQEWSDVSLKALDLADMILLVTSLEVPALTHARERLKLLQRLGADEEQIRVIVNRGDNARLGGAEFAKVLGRKPDANVPSAYEVALAGINEGRLVREVAPGSPLDVSLQRLAGYVYEWFNLGQIEIERSKSFVRRIGTRFTNFRDTVKGLTNGTVE
ncbi:MAG: AAA family ATPase [bacterium]|nr:AAA family ATPase [bacterium]